MLFRKKEIKKPLILFIQGSLSPTSSTDILLQEALRFFQREKNFCTEVLDLRLLDLDFCDGRKIERYGEDTRAAYARVRAADAYIFGMPIYCSSVSGALKNFIDITSPAMTGKVAGILCHSGGKRSYLASADLIKILSFEASVITVQPVVHTFSESFKKGKIDDEHIFELIEELTAGMAKLLKK